MRTLSHARQPISWALVLFLIGYLVVYGAACAFDWRVGEWDVAAKGPAAVLLMFMAGLVLVIQGAVKREPESLIGGSILVVIPICTALLISAGGTYEIVGGVITVIILLSGVAMSRRR
jgi:peptidoglycan/LPS O-acetylase OafA/YrhL